MSETRNEITPAYLVEKMRILAATHDRGVELREKAAELEEAFTGFWGEPQTKTAGQFLGIWISAWRLWCSCSGKPTT